MAAFFRRDMETRRLCTSIIRHEPPCHHGCASSNKLPPVHQDHRSRTQTTFDSFPKKSPAAQVAANAACDLQLQETVAPDRDADPGKALKQNRVIVQTQSGGLGLEPLAGGPNLGEFDQDTIAARKNNSAIHDAVRQVEVL
ncbi:MAG: hypothetical protein WBO55_18845 [Rhizobiaceae bacterium]